MFFPIDFSLAASPAAVAIIVFVAGLLGISAFHLAEVAIRRGYATYRTRWRTEEDEPVLLTNMAHEYNAVSAETD